MRVLGIDFGDVRIGLAISDPLGYTAQQLETITWRFNLEKPIDRIAELVRNFPCEHIVVGLPRNMDGSEGFRVDKTREFVKVLEERINPVSVEMWDERLTTVMAKRAMQEMGIRGHNQRGKVDQMAAAMILQSWLDSKSMPKGVQKE